MDGKLQVIAGILALFFLGVAIAKSMIQRARKREEAARRIAASKEAQEVSLHNPFSAEGEPAAPQAGSGNTEEPATPQGSGGKMKEAAADSGRRTTAGESGEAAEEAPSDSDDGKAESIYKWE